MTLTWSAATPGTSPVADYRVYAGDPAGTAPLATVPASTTTATVTGLSAATAYTFQVVATDTEGGSSPPSAPLHITTGPAPTSGCTVAYRISSDWGAGFTANVTITNRAAPVSGWSLGFAFAGNQKVTQGWSGTWSQTGTAVTVMDAGWNASLPTGGSTTIGFNGAYSGANAAPATFTLNGTTCTLAGTAAAAAPLPAIGRAPANDAPR
ncbi:cellulose binding domain-containing protein [Streptomyces sp. NPDC006733]|uniref:cellulose binding domain-containing protein n=1 Tax=Streptomyces sp. NPDC006733 TaxID=3155460 RepID=UPI0033C634AC